MGADAFDVLVVGGGSAGCVLAGRLSEEPSCRVGLVEAGPDYGPRAAGGWPADLLDADADAVASHDWGHPGGPASARARVIGGCSAINGCAIVRGLGEDYDEWSAADPAWSYTTIRPWLDRAELAIGARRTHEADLPPWRRAFLDAARAGGAPRLVDFNADDRAEGVGMATMNTDGRLRRNAAFAYLDPARNRTNLTILADTQVDALELDGEAVVGVRVRDPTGSETLRAAAVILAAGAYGSPAILMRSGIGAADVLRRHGIAPRLERPGVGEGLRDHALVDVPFAPTPALEAADARHRADASAQVYLKATSSARPRIPWDVLLGPWSESGHAGIMVMPTKPWTIGRVVLRSADPEMLPAVEHPFLRDGADRDLRAVIDGVRRAYALGTAPAMRTLAKPRLAPATIDDTARLAAWVRGHTAGNFHPCGTCRIGPASDSDAVVDGEGRVHGTANLYIADASVFPAIPRANIHLTVLAVAERIAAALSSAAGNGAVTAEAEVTAVEPRGGGRFS